MHNPFKLLVISEGVGCIWHDGKIIGARFSIVHTSIISYMTTKGIKYVEYGWPNDVGMAILASMSVLDPS